MESDVQVIISKGCKNWRDIHRDKLSLRAMVSKEMWIMNQMYYNGNNLTPLKVNNICLGFTLILQLNHMNKSLIVAHIFLLRPFVLFILNKQHTFEELQRDSTAGSILSCIWPTKVQFLTPHLIP